MKRKCLAAGIIALLVITILPSMTCSSTESNQSVGSVPLTGLNKISDDVVNWTINGTMGENGWYVGPVSFTCTYDPDTVASVYYKVYQTGNWQLYIEPFTIDKDGRYDFCWYWVDYQGTVSPVHGPFPFGIDQTPPVFINTSAKRLNPLGTKWLFIMAISEATSGIARVEVYVDDQLKANLTTPTDGYWTFEYQGNGKVAQAVAYDHAGNRAVSTPITMPLVFQQSQNYPSIIQKIMIIQNIIFALFHQGTKGCN